MAPILIPPTRRIANTPIPQAVIAPLSITPTSHVQTTLRPLHHLRTLRTHLPTLLPRHLFDSFTIFVLSTNTFVHFFLAQYTSPGVAAPAKARRNKSMDLRSWDESVA